VELLSTTIISEAFKTICTRYLEHTIHLLFSHHLSEMYLLQALNGVSN